MTYDTKATQRGKENYTTAYNRQHFAEQNKTWLV